MSSIAGLPRPVGVVYAVERPLYEVEMANQLKRSVEKQGEGSLEKLLNHGETWVIN